MKKGTSPLYHQLAQILRERIAAGTYLPGAAIPTEPQLCKEFDMSRITVRQAVSILETDGMVQRQQGRGTFVRDINRQSLGWNYGQVKDLLSIAKNSRLELLSKRKIKAHEKIARDLAIHKGDPVYAIKGNRYIKENHKAYYLAYIIESIGYKVELKPIDSQVLFLEIEKLSRERIQTANQFVYAVSANKEMAKAMDIEPGEALLATKRIYKNETGKPLMMAVTHYPGKIYQSVAILERN